jgi:DNA-binding transcriptional LysR family regulator
MPNIDFYYKRSRLNQLKGFCSVVQNECCIAKAAAKTNVAADTISKQIRTLERDLKIALMDRSKHHTLALTPEGKLFYEKAIIHLNGVNSLFENFHKDVKEFNDNHLNIALHHTAAAYIFPSILKKMLNLNEFKDLKINIHVIPKEEALKKLISKDIDIAFYTLPLILEIPVELKKIKSISDHTLLVFNKSHPLAKKQTVDIEDMPKYKFLKRNIGTKTYGNIFTCSSGITINGNSFEIALEIIKRTDNMTTLPELFIKSVNLSDSEIESRNIDHLIGSASFYILLRENETPTKPIAWLIKELKSLVL